MVTVIRQKQQQKRQESGKVLLLLILVLLINFPELFQVRPGKVNIVVLLEPDAL